MSPIMTFVACRVCRSIWRQVREETVMAEAEIMETRIVETEIMETVMAETRN